MAGCALERAMQSFGSERARKRGALERQEEAVNVERRARRTMKVAAAGAALAVGLSACGRSAKGSDSAAALRDVSSDRAQSSTTSPTSRPQDVYGVDGRRANQARKEQAPPPTTMGKPSAPNVETSPSAKSLPMTATLATQCVRPGGTQTITVRTKPKVRVAYGATYADGKSAMSDTFYGGNQGGVVGPAGEWQSAWVVGIGAPPGPVKVDVAGVDATGVGQTSVSFNVAGATGSCA
jgi:hypothetical protein